MDASFTITAIVHRQDALDNTTLMDYHETLFITGHPDPAGGVVCSARDDGKPHTLTNTSGGGNDRNHHLEVQ